ncbi:hypothetical protein [uncultured Microbulbifer sp.]|uniref:hypothetical protein n=1 Tax=uncultured Microbulbifer sp. TaxID=348147 RepID=UPI002610FC25|nr:hypothetical protein [uncultured Microbulbifer sp.]
MHLAGWRYDLVHHLRARIARSIPGASALFVGNAVDGNGGAGGGQGIHPGANGRGGCRTSPIPGPIGVVMVVVIIVMMVAATSVMTSSAVVTTTTVMSATSVMASAAVMATAAVVRVWPWAWTRSWSWAESAVEVRADIHMATAKMPSTTVKSWPRVCVGRK